jgi:hypothetical protein
MRAGEAHRRVVGIVGRIEDDDCIARPHQRLHARVDRLGRAQRHRDLSLRIDRHPRIATDAPRDLLAQRHVSGHRRVLVVALAHCLVHQLGELHVDRVIGKALAEVDGAELGRAPRHHGEDRRADVGQLAARIHHAVTPAPRPLSRC